MRTFIKYILAVSMMFCCWGCLDEHSKDQLDQEAIYNNADNIYKNAVASLYNYIKIHCYPSLAVCQFQAVEHRLSPTHCHTSMK